MIGSRFGHGCYVLDIPDDVFKVCTARVTPTTSRRATPTSSHQPEQLALLPNLIAVIPRLSFCAVLCCTVPSSVSSRVAAREKIGVIPIGGSDQHPRVNDQHAESRPKPSLSISSASRALRPDVDAPIPTNASRRLTGLDSGSTTLPACENETRLILGPSFSTRR